TRDLVSGRGRRARMPPGGQGRRRAAAGKAGAADFPERERVRETTPPRRGARRLPKKRLNVCRAGFAGRGTACARSTHAIRSPPVPTRDKGLGSVVLEPRAQAGYRRPG